MAKKAKATENGEDTKVKEKASKKKVSKSKVKREATQSDDDDGLITIAELAEEAEITAQSARIKLREAGCTKPEGGRWKFKPGSKPLKEARKILGV